MTLTPPQGAQSADPVREAMRRALEQIGLKGYAQAAETLRTALAAPEGPAPTGWQTVSDEVVQSVADDLQREFGLTYGILSKCTLGSMLVDALRLSVSVTSARAPEAPPPVEARQPQTGEPWDGIKYLLDSYPGAVRCRYKGLDEDLLASLSVTFIGLRDAARAALAAPAGAIQPHLDHQVESSSGTAAALGRITLLKGSVVKMGGLPHELLADVESYCASRAAAPQGGDTGAPS